MGTLKKLMNKVFFHSDETDEKEKVKVKNDIETPKDKHQRAFKPVFTINPTFSHCSPEFHPKHKKLKGWQKENNRKY